MKNFIVKEHGGVKRYDDLKLFSADVMRNLVNVGDELVTKDFDGKTERKDTIC